MAWKEKKYNSVRLEWAWEKVKDFVVSVASGEVRVAGRVAVLSSVRLLIFRWATYRAAVHSEECVSSLRGGDTVCPFLSLRKRKLRSLVMTQFVCQTFILLTLATLPKKMFWNHGPLVPRAVLTRMLCTMFIIFSFYIKKKIALFAYLQKNFKSILAIFMVH